MITKIFLDYTQEELDRAYTQSEWAPTFKEILSRQTASSARIRGIIKPNTVRYGEHPDEILDIFCTTLQATPVHVHIHGGAWRALTKDDVSFPALAFVRSGATYVALNFSVIPTVRLPEMVAQAQRAVAWLYANVADYGGDPDRIHLSGHSAGAHMAAVLLTTNWSARFSLPDDVLKSVFLMSGTYDLEPIMLSVRSSYVKISREELVQLSATRHVDQVRSPVTVAVGELESPEFKRQAQNFHRLLSEAAKQSSFIEVPGTNHFEMMDVFADGKGVLGRATLNATNVGAWSAP